MPLPLAYRHSSEAGTHGGIFATAKSVTSGLVHFEDLILGAIG